jgi:hypothetical protein
MLATSLEAATRRMMAPDSVAREEIVFGDAFVDHFGGTREHEVKLWNEAVTNWEGEFCTYCGGEHRARLECSLRTIMRRLARLPSHTDFYPHSRALSRACLSWGTGVRTPQVWP